MTLLLLVYHIERHLELILQLLSKTLLLLPFRLLLLLHVELSQQILGHALLEVGELILVVDLFLLLLVLVHLLLPLLVEGGAGGGGLEGLVHQLPELILRLLLEDLVEQEVQEEELRLREAAVAVEVEDFQEVEGEVKGAKEKAEELRKVRDLTHIVVTQGF